MSNYNILFIDTVNDFGDYPPLGIGLFNWQLKIQIWE